MKRLRNSCDGFVGVRPARARIPECFRPAHPLPLPVRMRHIITSAYALLRDDTGQDLIEYGMLASLIAILAMVTVGELGLQISDLWTGIVQLAEKL